MTNKSGFAAVTGAFTLLGNACNVPETRRQNQNFQSKFDADVAAVSTVDDCRSIVMTAAIGELMAPIFPFQVSFGVHKSYTSWLNLV